MAEWEAAKAIAGTLRQQAEDRLREVADELEHKMRDVLEHGSYDASGADDGSDRSHYYRYSGASWPVPRRGSSVWRRTTGSGRSVP